MNYLLLMVALQILTLAGVYLLFSRSNRQHLKLQQKLQSAVIQEAQEVLVPELAEIKKEVTRATKQALVEHTKLLDETRREVATATQDLITEFVAKTQEELQVVVAGKLQDIEQELAAYKQQKITELDAQSSKALA
jgi:LPS O-antigen subunit length determinant protein (WzzB/FepE family)